MSGGGSKPPPYNGYTDDHTNPVRAVCAIMRDVEDDVPYNGCANIPVNPVGEA